MIFGRTDLEKKLDTWLNHGGDLYELLRSEMNRPLTSGADARAVCRVLDAVREKGSSVNHYTISALIGFFQQANDSASEVFRIEGLPRLRLWVNDLFSVAGGDNDSAMFILKILEMYGQSEDVDLIARAARLPSLADEFMWSMIFTQFDSDHRYSNVMIEALRDDLPERLALVAYLDMANALAVAGKLDRHPFDSDSGGERLERFLRDTDEDNFSYAISATAALPFISSHHRGKLLSAAFEHIDPLVRIEASWAQAKSGDEEGFDRLAEFCRQPRFSYTAQLYLNELGRSEKIPEEARSDEFRAVAEMANWLAHPSELGRPPDSIELFDSRELFWPPTGDIRRLFLVKHSTDDEVGVGLVGSVRFMLFGEATDDLSAEDIYRLHCCWELEMNSDPRAPQQRSSKAGKEILAKHNSDFT